MNLDSNRDSFTIGRQTNRIVAIAAILISLTSFSIFSKPISSCDTIPNVESKTAVADEIVLAGDSARIEATDSIIFLDDNQIGLLDSISKFDSDLEWVPREIKYNPDPSRAVWMSALFPGLGQVYNRRYWKLPIIVGGYLGLGYATSWNNTMLQDYTRAYSDIIDNDPTTKSYMDFFPPTTTEESLDKTWLTNTIRSRRNMFRRNRDLCIICMVGVYLLAMVDAYVDASLAHFDISPDISMEVYPSLIQDSRGQRPAFGMQWAFNF